MSRMSALVPALLTLAVMAYAQAINLEEITANDEFRWGVGALHDGKINEAIDSLNRSLSFAPERPLTRYWLGRAYYRGGFLQVALDQWRWVAERGARTSVLDRWIERVELDRGLQSERLGAEISPGRYVTMVELPGVQGDLTLFRQPTSVRPRPDGAFYVASYATHTVVVIDPNGVRRQVIDGGLEGFDRPFDALPMPDGSLLVSEFGANRIARVNAEGRKVGSFGSRGIGPGQLLGPQFLAADGQGHVYVSDHGNARVSKFTTDGDYLLSFGGRTGRSSLGSPAGIVVTGGRVYVADTRGARIVVFDESGNELGDIRTPQMERPEGLSLYRPGELLVSDRNRLYVIAVNSEVVSVLSDLSPDRRLLAAVVDANRNIVAADVNAGSLLYLAASEELYTGLNVEIDFVNPLEHPRVYAAVTVTDRSGNPVLGLDAGNFRVTEDRFPTGVATIVYSGYRAGDTAISVVVDGSQSADPDALRAAAADLFGALGGSDRMWIVTASQDPVIETTPGAGRLLVEQSMVRGAPRSAGRLDLGIRLGVSQLLGELGRRALIVVSDGEISPRAFEAYSLAETAAHLRNNQVTFSVVYTRRHATSPELDYLAAATGGSAAYVYRPEGLGPLVAGLRERPSGRYLISYQSVHDSDFGRRYIPLEVEAYLLQRSGRDEAGYFGPLEF